MNRSFNLAGPEIMKLFSEDETSIAQTFLTSHLKIDFELIKFEEIRNRTIQEFSLTDTKVPKNLKEFSKYVCNEILNLKRLPRETLFDLLQRSLDDLNFIHKTKGHHEEKVEILKRDKNIEGKKYILNKHIYIVKRLKNDEARLIKFLREDLFTMSFSQSMPTTLNNFFIYPFGLNRFSYLHDNLVEISHKIGFAPITEVNKYGELFEKDKRKFYRIIKRNYSPTSLIKSIEETLNRNHLINKKKDILRKILATYKKRNWEVFINLCPQQIEGLLYDLCIEIGVKSTSLKTSSITDKINFINDRSEVFNIQDYQYFAFVFPIIRNKIAHGFQLNENLADLAYSLLFDLHTTIDFFDSEHFKYNKALRILKNIVSIRCCPQ